MNFISNSFSNILSFFDQIGTLFVALVSLALIIATIVFFMIKAKKINSKVSVLVSSLLCLFFAFPLITSVNHYIEYKALGISIESASTRTLNQKNEYIEQLEKEIEILKNAQLSMQSMKSICEVALLETQINSTDVHLDTFELDQAKTSEKLYAFWFGSSREQIMANRNIGQILTIQTHDVNAKFGIDINAVKVSEKDDNTLLISGIKSKYIGADKNIAKTPISEYRLYSNWARGIEGYMLNDADSLKQASVYSEKYLVDFQNKLSSGIQYEYMDKAVETLGQNFISVILKPLNKDIVFTEDSNQESVPILEYLGDEIVEKNELLSSLLLDTK